MRVDLASGALSKVGVDGIWPRVSSDGKFLYYFSRRMTDLTRIAISGGSEEILLHEPGLSWFDWSVGKRYLYLLQDHSRRNAVSTTLLRFSPESKQAVPLAEVPFRPRLIYVSPDERFVYLQQQEDPKQRVVVIHGLITGESPVQK